MRRLTRAAAIGAAATSAALSVGSVLPAHAATGLEGIPSYSHVVVLVVENESEASTWGTAGTYLNGLIPQGAFDDTYYATGHVSLDNYIAMTSGQPDQQATTGADCLAYNLYTCAQVQTAMDSGRNIADQVEAAGLTWHEYADGMPSPCFHADYSPTAQPPDPYQGDSTAAPAFNYADRHNPFNYYPDIVDPTISVPSTRCADNVVPYAHLATDLAANALPNYSFITPDTCHDGHDSPCANGDPGGLTSANLWLSQNVPPLLSYLDAHNGLLLITTDESAESDTSGCCTGGPGGVQGYGGQVGILALGAGITAGTVIHTPYDHMSQLRTVEDALGISEHLNNAGTATAMADLFAPGASLPEAPLAALFGLVPLALVAIAAARRRRTQVAA